MTVCAPTSLLFSLKVSLASSFILIFVSSSSSFARPSWSVIGEFEINLRLKEKTVESTINQKMVELKKKLRTVNFVRAVLQKQMAANIISHSMHKADKMSDSQRVQLEANNPRNEHLYIVAARYTSVLIKGVSSF